MFPKRYSNFVKASSPVPTQGSAPTNLQIISGAIAQKLYLEEIKDATNTKTKCIVKNTYLDKRKTKHIEQVPVTNKDLFLIVQNNDVDRLKLILNTYPDKLNIVDDYGWSLLMIACQANSVQTAQELLIRGIDMSVRDKAGNSARSLVIKNRNLELASLLIDYSHNDKSTNPSSSGVRQSYENRRLSKNSQQNKNEFTCEVCNKTFPDREEHFSSTLHNICASKGKKIPASYKIPQTNKGFQLMLKGGWDKDSGLGKDGSGKIYPIKTVQKKDRKGLGHNKVKEEKVKRDEKIKSRKREIYKSKNFEIHFRREFY